MNDNVKATGKQVKGGVAISLTCFQCGKPLTVHTDHGIFCVDRHGEARSKEELRQLKAFLKSVAVADHRAANGLAKG